MYATKLRDKWREGHPAFGFWAALSSPFAAELMSIAGIDYVCVDQQHGLADQHDALAMFTAVQARGAVPITRVPANQPWMIGKALDAGAQGVVVPLINTREEAEAAVAACRYPPHGTRSFGPVRAAVVGGMKDNVKLAESVLCIVMVETREGLANIDAIASTPGLDGIYVGPADLALGLGLPPDLDKTEPEHVTAVQSILDACKRHGIVAGIQCHSGKSGRAYAARGFGFVTIAKDTAMLQKAARNELQLATVGDDAARDEHVGYT
ncbi:HpcH/HpaI aldolase family protein [Pararobbsia silviterrae]|uniref:2,4-dihydroxyhept-2-ene-1,7-dioic acid aldolase n=1 Tax=Pararobbsia silviterrae TaxID=1792498 RepID=A0A494Y9I6_9BURK|nr:aldolase/citrate lyase family protein [Pararobbsia silviterrae]RKP59289.1 2,4-dihydroxyhept-2-ene-1,7-dioic acid aldolase [Pararobbsia silviterrae]